MDKGLTVIAPQGATTPATAPEAAISPTDTSGALGTPKCAFCPYPARRAVCWNAEGVGACGPDHQYLVLKVNTRDEYLRLQLAVEADLRSL